MSCCSPTMSLSYPDGYSRESRATKGLQTTGLVVGFRNYGKPRPIRRKARDPYFRLLARHLAWPLDGPEHLRGRRNAGNGRDLDPEADLSSRRNDRDHP